MAARSQRSARSRFGRTVFYPGKRLSASLDGRGCSTSERGESSDDGGSLSECSPEGPRSGDVGGAGLLTDFHNQLIDATPKDAAMLRETTRPNEKSPQKGGLNTPPCHSERSEESPSPFCVSKRGTRQAKRDAGGSHTQHPITTTCPGLEPGSAQPPISELQPRRNLHYRILHRIAQLIYLLRRD